MTIQEFEDAIWAIEGVRLVVRSAANKTVSGYDYKKAANETWHTSEWLKKRVVSKLGNLSHIVIDGNGEEPHGRTLLRNLRRTY